MKPYLRVPPLPRQGGPRQRVKVGDYILFSPPTGSGPWINGKYQAAHVESVTPTHVVLLTLNKSGSEFTYGRTVRVRPGDGIRLFHTPGWNRLLKQFERDRRINPAAKRKRRVVRIGRGRPAIVTPRKPRKTAPSARRNPDSRNPFVEVMDKVAAARRRFYSLERAYERNQSSVPANLHGLVLAMRAELTRDFRDIRYMAMHASEAASNAVFDRNYSAIVSRMEIVPIRLGRFEKLLAEYGIQRRASNPPSWMKGLGKYERAQRRAMRGPKRMPKESAKSIIRVEVFEDGAPGEMSKYARRAGDLSAAEYQDAVDGGISWRARAGRKVPNHPCPGEVSNPARRRAVGGVVRPTRSEAFRIVRTEVAELGRPGPLSIRAKVESGLSFKLFNEAIREGLHFRELRRATGQEYAENPAADRADLAGQVKTLAADVTRAAAAHHLTPAGARRIKAKLQAATRALTGACFLADPSGAARKERAAAALLGEARAMLADVLGRVRSLPFGYAVPNPLRGSTVQARIGSLKRRAGALRRVLKRRSLSQTVAAELRALLQKMIADTAGAESSLDRGQKYRADWLVGRASSWAADAERLLGVKKGEMLPNPGGRYVPSASAVATFERWHDRPPGRVERVSGPPRSIPAELVKLGTIPEIVYKSDKWGEGMQTYSHKTEKPLPVLATDPEGKNLYIVGGNVRVTRDGLVG